MDFGIPSTGDESCVDAVRALHQTIYALRNALERSRNEILELKENSWPKEAVGETVRHLSIENHVLRQKVVNTEIPEKSKSISKKIKRRESKEVLQTIQRDYNYKNIDINIDNNNRKASTSLENVSTSQSPKKLSKSRTVCFSNTFEGERQISTCNSFHIASLKQHKSNKISKEGFNEEDLTKEDCNKHKSKGKGLISNKNLCFKEEIISEDLTVSKNGSITNFVKETQDSIEKLEKPIKHFWVSKSKGDGAVITGIKREVTFIKSTEDNTKVCKKSSVLNEQFSDKNKVAGIKNKAKVIRSDKKENEIFNEKNVKWFADSNKSAGQSTLSETTSDTVLKKEKLKIINIELAELLSKGKIETDEPETTKESTKIDESNDTKTIEYTETKESSSIKSIECKETDQSSAKTIECTKTVENNSVKRKSIVTTENIAREIEENCVEQTIKGIANNIQTSSNKVASLSTSQVELIGTNKEINSPQINPNSPNSSGTSSTSSVNEKKVEVSVKIYKGLKKPIEIDIQTKKKHRSSKKAPKQPKMNNKSQSTPYERVSQISTREVQTHIDTATSNNIVTNLLQNDAEQEVDEVELIFTTEDTKDTDFKEELVPIDAYTETQLLPCPMSDYDEKLSAETSDRELEDDVFNDNFENENQENCNFQYQTYDFRRENSQIYNSKSDNSINRDDKSLKSYYSYQDSSFENKSLEKDESFDRFEEKDSRIIETDISKIGIQDVEYNLGRRNTCPNPIQYRPIMHREALGRGVNSRKCRPILAHSNVIRKESGAQTDISALPGSSWRSESSLGHKVKIGENFTTLPSKYPHPGSRLRLSEKTVEARRVLLSDIGFTSMVPELSRSADHLFPPVVRGPVVSSYGQFLRTTDLYSPAYTSQKFVWTTTTPSEGSHSHSRYSSQYPLASPPAPTRRCSAPVSPSKKATVLKTAPSRVRFANGSLPELRGDWAATVDSGESTDSLVEEAEHFLRRSIDCLAPCKEICFRNENIKIGARRASAPEPSRDNVPPQGWQPFLPRIPRDLHLDYWVKVISPEGRVRGGRVRYVGPLIHQPEAFVGVQLSTPDGHSDGTHNNRRYFNCEPYHGLFVPFKKIIMGWRP